MAVEGQGARRHGVRVALEEMGRRAGRTPNLMLLFGPAILVAAIMLVLEAFPTLKTAGDLAWNLAFAAGIALWFFGRLAYFAVIGVPVDGPAPKVLPPFWPGFFLLLAGLALALMAFIVLGLILN